MPSPFPGMDPYLEDPGIWPDVHHRLITICSDYLGERIRPNYVVRIQDRVYISDENDPGRSVIIPDLRIAERPTRKRQPFNPGAGPAVGLVEPIVATTMTDGMIHEARLEIVDREQRVVVTVIELLSPTNKVMGSRGRASFELKRREVMNSPSHWLEIDLLREGSRVWVRELIDPNEYLIHLSRVENRPSGFLWPVRLSDRLPTIPIPLKPGDPDAYLDLQAVLNTAYDRANYDLSLDYSREPSPPLTPEWAGWAADLLKESGHRPVAPAAPPLG